MYGVIGYMVNFLLVQLQIIYPVCTVLQWRPQVGGGNPIAAASTDKLRYCDSERGRGGWVKKSEHFADVI